MTATAIDPAELTVYRQLMHRIFPDHPGVDCVVMFDHGTGRGNLMAKVIGPETWAGIGAAFVRQAQSNGNRRVTLMQFSADADDTDVMRVIANALIREGILVVARIAMHNEEVPS